MSGFRCAGQQGATRGHPAAPLGRAAVGLPLREAGAQRQQGLRSPLGNLPRTACPNLTRAPRETMFSLGKDSGALRRLAGGETESPGD